MMENQNMIDNTENPECVYDAEGSCIHCGSKQPTIETSADDEPDMVEIEIVRGLYTGQKWWGDLSDAPATVLVPDLLASSPNIKRAAAQARADIRAGLERSTDFAITVGNHTLRVRRAGAPS